jgi:hypothetical protein
MAKQNDEPINAIIVDERNGTQIERGATRQEAEMPSYAVELDKVGTSVITPDEAKILNGPLNPEDVQIRPDGLVYLPWTWYAARLNKAIGVLQWGNIPQGMPMSKAQGTSVLVVWGHWLIIRGIPVGFSLGETSYYPNNFTMSYADACEGAKSISLTRNCKLLGMALELWDPSWVADWQRKYAERYKNDKDKMVWRKKVVKPDPEQEGKRGLIKYLVPLWYATSKDVGAALEAAKLTYSLKEHDNIVKKLITDVVKAKK